MNDDDDDDVNQPFPLSVQVVYHVNSSNGRDTIASTDNTAAFHRRKCAYTWKCT